MASTVMDSSRTWSVQHLVCAEIDFDKVPGPWIVLFSSGTIMHFVIVKVLCGAVLLGMNIPVDNVIHGSQGRYCHRDWDQWHQIAS